MQNHIVLVPGFWLGAWAWDDDALDMAVNEAPLQHQGQSLRIDRLVRLRQARAGARWWVLDYKLQHAPAEVAADLVARMAGKRLAITVGRRVPVYSSSTSRPRPPRAPCRWPSPTA